MTKPILIDEVSTLPLELLTSVESRMGELSVSQVSSEAYEMLKDARVAAEAHRRSRYKLQQIIKPGISLNNIVETIEESTRISLKGQMNDGIGFPTGVSINNCAAHYTTNPGDKNVYLSSSDVLKIDFGTHVNGRIMDSAFTICFDNKYEDLLKASKEATERGLRCIGVDVRVCDIGAEIGEVIESFELAVDNKVLPIIPVRNLNGHSISQYEIHSGITIPITRNNDTTKIKSDTFYAVETFATTGEGYVVNGGECSHFILNKSVRKQVLSEKSRNLLNFISKNIGTLPFCPRYVDSLMENKFSCKPNINILSRLKFLDPYPPLFDSKDSLVSQFEHTVFVSEFGKEILTKGKDY